ncbi:hypothetical protein T552_01222 [Pneumocystis carinii B80]|uniref:N-glycosylase/DNA lyase n=1 Tax=Pneumocystis carinii (strain B80) TaxID=1408658 RepID=A0A0W4ZLM1_PNEC8|nr:hypothetical protein T552_01222 [Pneumocystis carinii B80]KTW29267.1 hypothetical protein T552_01222 [Pneumocystis carinii B80]
MSVWKKIKIKLDELCLESTLKGGQSFRWKQSGDNEWSCALNNKLITLKQDCSYVYYRVYKLEEELEENEENNREFLIDYFNLSICLSDLYKEWSFRDENFRKQGERFKGIRIMRQDPWENLICFICSSNNNINRISSMIEKLCHKYGTFVGRIGKNDYYDFPAPSKLSKPSVELELRELGFGYRAKFIQKTAWIIENERPKKWLESLRNKSYYEAKNSLCELMGVGYKVADCVCLMSLDQPSAVPIDTHVWQIAQRDYKFNTKKYKTINKTLYETIGDYYRNLWGEYAGWAQGVLFTSDLSIFKNRAKIEKNLPKLIDQEKTNYDKISKNNKL